MSTKHESPGRALLTAWRRLAPLPAGPRIFSWYVGRMAPYSGSMGARVVSLEPGYALLELRDRRRVRNHLASIHAIALANLGELATGLAMTSALPATVRGIPIRLEIDYIKKARGRLTAESRCRIPPVTGEVEHQAEADIRDRDGDVVARIRVRWRLGPLA
jgi:acyl-coenzyme A thioesterase PaaI-like protein